MKESRAIFTVFLTLLVSLTVLYGADLPLGHMDFVPTPERPVGWRGDGTGQYPGATPPLEWSETKNIAWKTPLPSWIFSTPVPACGKVFTCAEPATLLCLDAKTGAVLWSHDHDKNGGNLATGVNSRNSTPTPVCDGTRVYARFANGVNVAYDLNGDRQWLIVRGENKPNVSIMDASPALFWDRLVICVGRELLGLDTATGKEVWKYDTGSGDSKAHSPVIGHVGKTAMVLPAFGRALDPGSGQPATSELGINARNSSPMFMDGVVYAVGEERGGNGWNAAVRLEPGATGIAVKELWKNRYGGAMGKSKFPDGPLGANVQERFYASPVIYEGVLITQNQGGNLYAIDPETGGILKMFNLANSAKAAAPQGGVAVMSPAVAGGRLFIKKRDGPVVVFQGKDLKEVARNYLDMSGVTKDMGGVHSFDSSLAFQGNCIYVRTHKALYCIGNK